MSGQHDVAGVEHGCEFVSGVDVGVEGDVGGAEHALEVEGADLFA